LCQETVTVLLERMAIIGHLDMDAFFAAVEERENPRLKGRAIVVGSDPEGGKGRGVVATANYKARAYGIHSAMPISKAWRLATEGLKKGEEPVVFMEAGFSKYGKASEAVMKILRKHVSKIEQASVDEAYFDLSFTKSYDAARKLAAKIKKEIETKEKLTASVGVGPNKMIAKIASDMEKPNGLTVIGDDDPFISADMIEDFLAPLPIRKVPGIGPKTEMELKHENILTIKDLQKLSEKELTSHFGKWGSDLYAKSRGRASTEIVEEWEAKSIGEQTTFDVDTLDPLEITRTLKEVTEDVGRRFKQSGSKTFRTIVLTVRFADFTTKNRSHSFPKPISDTSILIAEALRMIMPFLDSRENPKRQKLRLLGFRVEKLT
jgi:DNA polymerase IV (DinB-like DNA polymerase)